MNYKSKTTNKLLSVLKFIILAIFMIFILFPFVWMILTSLKGTQGEIYAFPIVYFPKPVSFVNYSNMLGMGNFGRYFLNSLIVSFCAGALSVTCGILGGYIIARYNFKAKGAILFVFLFTQMIPMFIMLAPLYQMMAKLNMINNPVTLVLLYTNMTIPFSVVTLRGFFAGIPKSLEEAAMIDGCGRLSALFRVIIPTMLPGIASTFIFAFVNSWNELFAAIMFIDVDKYKTIPVALNALILKNDIKWGEMAAGTVMSIIPTILLFAFAQKYMIAGLTQGAVKE